MGLTNKDLILFVFGILANFFSTYLFFIGWMNLITLSIIIACSIIAVMITSIQLKNFELEQKLEKQEKEQERILEKLKIYEKLINLEARIIALEK